MRNKIRDWCKEFVSMHSLKSTTKCSRTTNTKKNKLNKKFLN